MSIRYDATDLKHPDQTHTNLTAITINFEGRTIKMGGFERRFNEIGEIDS